MWRAQVEAVNVGVRMTKGLCNQSGIDSLTRGWYVARITYPMSNVAAVFYTARWLAQISSMTPKKQCQPTPKAMTSESTHVQRTNRMFSPNTQGVRAKHFDLLRRAARSEDCDHLQPRGVTNHNAQEAGHDFTFAQ
ncbi:hypothetical protein SUGI_1198050 [Cryptomeria japonica]|nr:hypothetical protein SUGI_1198050 [Cryptomeria japonica]